MPRPSWLAFAIAMCLTSVSAAGPVQKWDFEDGTLAGWYVGAPDSAAEVKAVRGMGHAGDVSLALFRANTDFSALPKLVSAAQGFDATPYRGKRVGVSGWVRYEPARGRYMKGTAAIWITADGQPMARNEDAVGIQSDGIWTYVSTSCEVASDARRIGLGCTLYDAGTAYFDEIEVSAYGPNGEGDSGPSPLTPRARDNLVAFARLVGFVRHFHPTDEAARADWDQLVMAGVEHVEPAKTPDDLRLRLTEVFAPVAPTVRIDTRAVPALTPSTLKARLGSGTHIIGWRHRGWPGNVSRTYSEARIVAQSGAEGDSLLGLGSEINVPLAGGVWSSVPLTLHVSGGHTVPAASSELVELIRPPGWAPTGNDRTARIAGVILLWNVIQHYDPYLDSLDVDWSSALARALDSAAVDTTEAQYLSTLRRMGSLLRDGHVAVTLPAAPKDPAWPLEWRFLDESLIVVRIDPKKSNDVAPGDQVLEVNGRAVDEWSSKLRTEWQTGTLERTRLVVAREILKASRGDTLALRIRRSDGSIHVGRVFSGSPDTARPARPDKVADVAPGILYIDLTRATQTDVRMAMTNLNAHKGIIFDFRGYPSQFNTEAMAHLTDRVVMGPPTGLPIILHPDRKSLQITWRQWNVPPLEPHVELPTATIIDARAISASETLLAVMEGAKLSVLVGEATAGTNGDVTAVRLPGQYVFSFTGLLVHNTDGSRHDKIGVLPQVNVRPTVTGIAAGRDEQLERAIEVVLAGSRQ